MITGNYHIYRKELHNSTVYNLRYEMTGWFNVRYWVWYDFSEGYHSNFYSIESAKSALACLMDDRNPAKMKIAEDGCLEHCNTQVIEKGCL